MSNLFASKGRGQVRRSGVDDEDHRRSHLPESSLAWIDCEIDQVVEGGDHWIVLGRVLGSRRPT